VAVRVAVAAAITAGMTWSVVYQWPRVRATWLDLAWESVLLSVLAALAGMFANVMAWRAAAADLEHDVPVPTALRICLVGQLGKYIPGSVWAYVLQMELAKRAGLPRARAFLATLVTVGLGACPRPTPPTPRRCGWPCPSWRCCSRSRSSARSRGY
jgi:hypothetical protein